MGFLFCKLVSLIICSLLIVLILETTCSSALTKMPKNLTIPAKIIFGDSIVDPGNNNYIGTIVKCNFQPYGRDFEGGNPTGRFSNGKVPSDLLAEAFGVKEFLPPYLDPSLQLEDLLTGVSFASGGTGYDPLTSKIVSVLSLSDQLELFKKYKQYGFQVNTKGCCGTGNIEVSVLCNPATPHSCPDASKYVFWDSYHPTEKAYKIIIPHVVDAYVKTFF